MTEEWLGGGGVILCRKRLETLTFSAAMGCQGV